MTKKRDKIAELLRAHAADCEECEREGPAVEESAVERLAGHMSAGGDVPVDPAGLSRTAMARLGPELQARAARAYWRRVLQVGVAALAPLPAVLAYDAYALRFAYEIIARVLPQAMATYLIASYAALLALLFATTYAAIPLLVERSGMRRLPAGG